MEGCLCLVSPSLRSIILPPGISPRGVRGKDIAIWVFVDEFGRVVADSTQLHPGSGDPAFDARLRRQTAEWFFEPAWWGGRPSVEWFRYVIAF